MERVSVIYPDDTYGNIAASAFVRAVRSTEGVNIDSNAAGETPSTIELVKRCSTKATAAVPAACCPSVILTLDKPRKPERNMIVSALVEKVESCRALSWQGKAFMESC